MIYNFDLKQSYCVAVSIEELSDKMQAMKIGERMILGFSTIKAQAEYVLTKVMDWKMHVVKKPTEEQINGTASGSKGIIISIATTIGRIVEARLTYDHEREERERARTRLQMFVEDKFSYWSDLFYQEAICVGADFDLMIINTHDEVLGEIARNCDTEGKICEAVSLYLRTRAMRINDFALKTND